MKATMAVFAEKIKLAQYYTERIFARRGADPEGPYLGRIDQITRELQELYDRREEGERKMLLEQIISAGCPFLNVARFALTQGVAFCHNFPPTINTSAYVAARRLPQVARLYGQPIAWHCFRANMHTRANDPGFDRFFGRMQCASVTTVGQETYWDEKFQYEWGRQAFETARNLEARVMYSRSMWVGSHIAAWLYKRKYPNTFWYAEFSDPHYITPENTVRTCNYNDLTPYQGNFYSAFERIIMESADYLIFTNKEQKDFMIAGNAELTDKAAIRQKSHALIHPPVDKRYAQLSGLSLDLDKKHINIGYFGSVYRDRNLKDLFTLLNEFPLVRINVFLVNKKYFFPPEHLCDRIVVRDALPNFDFLNAASQLDLLYLEDIDFSGAINPFLPSKLVEYLASGNYILLKRCKNSPLSRFKSKKLIDIHDFKYIYEKLLATKIDNQ